MEDRELRMREEFSEELHAASGVQDAQRDTSRKIQAALNSKIDELQDELVASANLATDLRGAVKRDATQWEARLRDAEDAAADLEARLQRTEEEKEKRVAKLCDELSEERLRYAEAREEAMATTAQLAQERAAFEGERARLVDRATSLEQSRDELTLLLARIRADAEKLKVENDFFQTQYQLDSQAAQQQQQRQRAVTHVHHEEDGARQGAMGLDLDANTLTVTRVVPGGPSYLAGIKKGDVIAAVQTENDALAIPVECVHVLRNTLSISGGVADGSEVAVTVVRKGRRRTFPLTLIRDDGSVANTMMRHLKKLKLDHPGLNIPMTTRLATNETALQEALKKVLPHNPEQHISFEALMDCLHCFNTSIGLPIFTAHGVHELYPHSGSCITILPGLKELFYSSLRGLELGE